MKCFNCLDDVYMDDLGDVVYLCPVCGDWTDTRYPVDYPDVGYISEWRESPTGGIMHVFYDDELDVKFDE